tara:strand:+ start:5613 stop:6371 length:759 start_codon:yes stop_codon:yes gene_type:complete
MVNYSNGKIYKIWSVQTDEIYVGSTTQALAMRLAKHRSKHKIYNQRQAGSRITSFKILDYGDAKIELIENFKCSSREELMAREGYYIRKLNCVNKRIMGRTKKQYSIDNKEKIKQYRKQHYEDNKEKIKLCHKKYAQDNKERIKLCHKQYHEANKEKILQYRKQHYEDNKERIKETNKQYYEANKEKIKLCHKKYAQDHKERKKQYDKQRYTDNKERLREKMKCECGSTITRQSLAKHKKTKKHLTLIASSP